MIETKIRYDGKVPIKVMDGDYYVEGHLFVRIDYHEDGSQSEYYGVEVVAPSYGFLVKRFQPHKFNPHSSWTNLCCECGQGRDIDIHYPWLI